MTAARLTAVPTGEEDPGNLRGCVSSKAPRGGNGRFRTPILHREVATLASLNSPTGVAVDVAGNLYIGDEGNGRVRKVTPQGIISTAATGGPAVGTDNAGNLYFSNGNRIQKLTPQGGLSSVATLASLVDARAIAVDTSANIYVADGFGHRVWKVTPQGGINTAAGNGTTGFSGDGGLATAAELDYPNGVATDAIGNLYISDAQNNRVRKVTPKGIITTIAGRSTAGPGVFTGGDWSRIIRAG